LPSALCLKKRNCTYLRQAHNVEAERQAFGIRLHAGAPPVLTAAPCCYQN